MDTVALWTEDSDEKNARIPERVQRRFIRDKSNIMNLDNRTFVKNFRLNKNAFMYVLNCIDDDLKAHRKSSAVSPVLKLAATLKFLAQGQIGQDRPLGFSKSSISACLSDVCESIERKLCAKHIVFEMTEEQKLKTKRDFFNKCGIPGVIGAVDGIHIQIMRPANDEHLFLNRKQKYCINAMAICDHEMFIRSINGRFGGACHDSHVWKMSNERQYLKENFENGDEETRILGDSGYPLEPWLLTPYRKTTENSPESFFNDQHSKGRSIIEKTFGLLKSRFRCLLVARELHYTPQKAVQLLNVCCALHNICLLFNVENPGQQNEDVPYTSAKNSFANIAKNLRNEIMNNMRRNL